MDPTTALAVLRPLEVALHQPQIRSDHAAMQALLHAEFRELGRCGQMYCRDDVLREFLGQPPSYQVWSQDYQADVVTDGLTILTYKSAHMEPDGSLSRFTARMSVWQVADQGWQVRFHQGTPCAPFERAEPDVENDEIHTMLASR